MLQSWLEQGQKNLSNNEIPFCTHEGSGQSGTYKQIRKLCSGADTLDGFSVNADKVKTKSTQKRLRSWLQKVDVKSRSAKAVPITITIGKRKLNGVCYNTPLGKQIMEKFPLKVTMDEFGGREYYGDVAKKDRPTKKSKGKLHWTGNVESVSLWQVR